MVGQVGSNLRKLFANDQARFLGDGLIADAPHVPWEAAIKCIVHRRILHRRLPSRAKPYGKVYEA